MKIFITGATLLLLTSCASFDKSQCNNNEVHTLGYETAKSGESDKGFKDFAQQCQEHKMTADHTKYKEGYNKGLKEFCTNKSAFAYGKTGKPNNNTCPKAKKFAKYYDKGLAIYKVETEIQSKSTAISEIENKIKLTKTTEDEKKSFQKQIKDLQREKFELENKLNLLSKK